MDNIADFIRKYQNCFIQNKETGAVHFIEGTSRDGGNVLRIDSEEFGTMSVSYNERFLKSYEIDFPPIGFFQHKTWALLLVKKYDRQYKRGLGNETGTVINPLGYFGDYIQIPSVPKLGWAVATRIWNRPNWKLSLDAAREKILEEKLNSIMLNRMFSLSLSHVDSGFILWNMFSPVAQVSPMGNVREIRIVDEAFRQEVRDYLERTRQSAWRIKNG